MTTSMYDAVAPYYRDYAATRSVYLSAVDRFIVEHRPARVASVLDVGAGDGVRGMALARELGAARVVLCEPSAAMAARCRALAPDAVWECSAEDMPEDGTRFDVVLCLWNVLGHVEGTARRVSALRRMAGRLADGGAIFLDVNNRHNAAAYGWKRVAGRVILDRLSPDERRGDASFDWRFGDVVVPAMGHLFTPREIMDDIAAAGLRVSARVAIDYLTGARSAGVYRGQLVFVAQRADPPVARAWEGTPR